MNLLLFSFTPEVQSALGAGQPVLALESTIFAHGMPYPQNIAFAEETEKLVRSLGVVPAIIAIIEGKICIGITRKQLDHLARGANIHKVAVRDLSHVLSRGLSGATTVSATMRVAKFAGIDVFSTGGIGGVHRGWKSTGDVSQDIRELSRTSVVVVSSGAKAILDLPKTVEYLESFSVPVLGYKTNFFPAFYSRSSGIRIEVCVDSPQEIAKQFNIHRGLGLSTAFLIANPVPQEKELSYDVVSAFIEKALYSAKETGITGKKLTPFLLSEMYRLSGGKSLKTNIALALNNIHLGARVAIALSKKG
ncbi:MAG: pseudouridine-5'-phosphate glycosidase [Candidatus Marinimicrobia bacterium]|nr:pseudouridine-5'-phosphate glycosidase [Candidatus Neomarinimicrobiota bacterium]